MKTPPIDLKLQAAAPSVTYAGYITLYADSDSNLATVDNSGTVRQIVGEFSTYSGKSTVSENDYMILEDSEDSNAKKKVLISDLRTAGVDAVSDAEYGVSWDGDTTNAPSKNAIYDFSKRYCIDYDAYLLTDADDNKNVVAEYSEDTVAAGPIELLVHFNGADEDVSATDRSSNAHPITFVGTAQIDTAQAWGGSGSLLLDGNSDYLTIPDDSTLTLSTDDFLIEARVRFNSISGTQVIMGQQSQEAAVLTGSIDPTASTTVNGVGTAFTTELVPGDRILVSGETRIVDTITSDILLTVTQAFSDNPNDTSPERLEEKGWKLIHDSSGQIGFSYATIAGTWTDQITVASGIGAATWYWVAVCRIGSSLGIYVIEDGSTAAPLITYDCTGDDIVDCSKDLWIGASPESGGSEFFNGHIDEVSISIGGTRDITDLTTTYTPQTYEYSVTQKYTIGEFATALDDLTDVTITTPIVDEVLKYNGTTWVNGESPSVGVGTGIIFYMDDDSILPADSENTYPVNTLLKDPDTVSPEDVDTISCASNTVAYGSYLYNTALGGSSIDSGIWEFNTYCSVSSTGGGRVSSITRALFHVVVESETVTTTGTGTSRTCTASGGTLYVSGDANADQTLAGYVQTPKGLYQITAYSSGTVCTILVPVGYANESGVATQTWKNKFQVTTDTITSLTTNYQLYSNTTFQAAIPIAATDKIGERVFATSNNTTDVYFTHNGTEHYTHFHTPITLRHNDLAGLFGDSEYYHLTAADYTPLATHGTSLQYLRTNSGATAMEWHTIALSDIGTRNHSVLTLDDGTNPHSTTKSDVGLGNVENTALSTWAGSTNITTLGTIATGTVPWANVDKTTSSIADITTRSATNVDSGNLPVAQLPLGGAWTLTSNLDIDSGTLYVDQSNNRVSIGTTVTNVPLTVYEATNSTLQFTNSTTGTTATDGLVVQVSGVNTIINNQETGYIDLKTASTSALQIGSDQNIGIGIAANVNHKLYTYTAANTETNYHAGRFRNAAAHVANSGTRYGARMDSTGAKGAYTDTVNYAIYATASAADTNYCLYGASGDAYFADNVSMGGVLEVDREGDATDAYIQVNADNTNSSQLRLTDEDSGSVFILDCDHSTNYTYFTVFGSNAISIDNNTARVYLPNLGSGTGKTDVQWDSSTKELIYDSSTIKHKEDVKEISDEDTDWIYNLKPKNYHRKSDPAGKREIGLIAEEVAEVNEEAICLDEEGEIIGYSRSALIIPMLTEIKKLKEEIAELKK